MMLATPVPMKRMQLILISVDAQQAALALKVLCVGERVRGGVSDRAGRGDCPVRDTDHRHCLELQAFHPVHGPDADGVLRRPGRQ